MRMVVQALVAAVAVPEAAQARASDIPKDAPTCLPPATRQVFIAPMGQVFRADPGRPYPAAAWIAQADRDGDGWVGRDEMAADAAAFFRTLDRDGDGKLTPDEVAAYERDVAPEIALFRVRATPGGDGRGRGYAAPLGAGLYAWLNIPEPVASADLDIDRSVSAAEFAAAAARRFDLLDTDHRGRIRLADLPRTPQQAAIEGPCRPPKPRRERTPDAYDDLPPGANPSELPR